eukprot:tig00000178_g12729.t1
MADVDVLIDIIDLESDPEGATPATGEAVGPFESSGSLEGARGGASDRQETAGGSEQASDEEDADEHERRRASNKRSPIVGSGKPGPNKSKRLDESDGEEAQAEDELAFSQSEPVGRSSSGSGPVAGPSSSGTGPGNDPADRPEFADCQFGYLRLLEPFCIVKNHKFEYRAGTYWPVEVIARFYGEFGLAGSKVGQPGTWHYVVNWSGLGIGWGSHDCVSESDMIDRFRPWSEKEAKKLARDRLIAWQGQNWPKLLTNSPPTHVKRGALVFVKQKRGFQWQFYKTCRLVAMGGKSMLQVTRKTSNQSEFFAVPLELARPPEFLKQFSQLDTPLMSESNVQSTGGGSTSDHQQQQQQQQQEQEKTKTKRSLSASGSAIFPSLESSASSRSDEEGGEDSDGSSGSESSVGGDSDSASGSGSSERSAPSRRSRVSGKKPSTATDYADDGEYGVSEPWTGKMELLPAAAKRCIRCLAKDSNVTPVFSHIVYQGLAACYNCTVDIADIDWVKDVDVEDVDSGDFPFVEGTQAEIPKQGKGKKAAVEASGSKKTLKFCALGGWRCKDDCSLVCSNSKCKNIFCRLCIEACFGKGVLQDEELTDTDPTREWICFECRESRILKRQERQTVYDIWMKLIEVDREIYHPQLVSKVKATNRAIEKHNAFVEKEGCRMKLRMPSRAAVQAEGLIVVSLFDGIAGAYHSLVKADIKVHKYYCVDIDRDVVKLVSDWSGHDPEGAGRIISGVVEDLSKVDARAFLQKIYNEHGRIDLLVAGFPCNDLARNNPNGRGLDGDHSSLVHKVAEFLDAARRITKNHGFPFLVENVHTMHKTGGKDSAKIVDGIFKVENVAIDAIYFTAAKRKRRYWTNIPIERIKPDRKRCLLQDFLSGTNRLALVDHVNTITTSGKKVVEEEEEEEEKDRPRGSTWGRPSAKSPWARVVKDACTDTTDLSKCTLLQRELEVLMGFPANYTADMGTFARRKVLGNSFCIPVIAHILKGLLPHTLGPAPPSPSPSSSSSDVDVDPAPSSSSSDVDPAPSSSSSPGPAPGPSSSSFSAAAATMAAPRPASSSRKRRAPSEWEGEEGEEGNATSEDEGDDDGGENRSPTPPNASSSPSAPAQAPAPAPRPPPPRNPKPKAKRPAAGSSRAPARSLPPRAAARRLAGSAAAPIELSSSDEDE